MIGIAVLSFLLTRGQVADSDGYFLAGRSLTGLVIAGSLLLTNISAEQIIGLAGSAYAFNLSSMAWEVMAVLAIAIMAIVLLPRYLAMNFKTLPSFLGARFNVHVQRLTVMLFLLAYGLITIPSILYSGTIAVVEVFSDDLRGLGSFFPVMLVIAFIGTAYSVAGGLRAIAISDALNGLGLLFFGFLIPLLALNLVGSGSLIDGWHIVTTVHPEKFNAIGSDTDPTPFATLFTGMLFANLAYWGTNQYVIQRALAAKSLAAGQKGVLFAGFFKLLIPFFVMLPGIIAFHLYGDSLGSMDQAYPRLIKDVLPPYLMGFFLAVLLGTVFSSFNSLLQSTATLVTYDLIVPNTSKPLADETLVKIGRYVCIGITLIGLVTAPLLQGAPDGLWQVIRKFSGFYNIPIVVIVLAALFIRSATPVGAISVIIFHLIVYGLITFVVNTGIHFIHWYGILFILEMIIILLVRGPKEPIDIETPAVDMTPWRYRWAFCSMLGVAIIVLYVVLSPVGLASVD